METETKAIVRQSELTRIREIIEQQQEQVIQLHSDTQQKIPVDLASHHEACLKEGNVAAEMPALDMNWKREEDETPVPEKMGEKARDPGVHQLWHVTISPLL